VKREFSEEHRQCCFNFVQNKIFRP